MVARVRADEARLGSRSVPTDVDRDRLQANADRVVECLRQGLSTSLLDVTLAGLHGASIQRIYVKLVLRGVVRWLSETLTHDDLMAYAHHVSAQDGPATPVGVSAGKFRLLHDKAMSTVLRAMARLVDEA